MFPLYDSIKAKRFPFLTVFLVLLNVFVFIQEIIAPDSVAFINQNALIPANINWADYHTLVPFVTAIFLHGGLIHIVSNMWFLWIFGDDVEGYLPPFIFLLLFLLAGVLGNLVQYFFDPTSTIPILGASGAVAGVLGCYFVFFPYSKIRTLVFLFIFVTVIDISAPLMLGYWFVLQFLSGATSLPFASSQGGVAFFAHVAGFLVGVVFALIFRGVLLQERQNPIIEGEILSK